MPGRNRLLPDPPVFATGLNRVMDGAVVDWLLEGDPAIRWQVMRDLLDEPAPVWEEEQQRIATDGWGLRLLAHQGPDGRWTPKLYGYKWISTTYSLALLRRIGLPPGDVRASTACSLFLDEALWDDGGINISVSLKRSEACVTGMVLAMLSWFRLGDPRQEHLVDYLLETQMPDGGWNCEQYLGAKHSSFHTTINVLEGLREYAVAGGSRASETETAEGLGREFLLEHNLFRSHRTGAVVDDRMLRLSFPPRWRYDILRSLDHFAAAGAPTDPRLDDAIEIVTRKRRSNGRWPLQQRHAGRTWFEMEEVGQPSRWNTLRALRVLRWWDGAQRAPM